MARFHSRASPYPTLKFHRTSALLLLDTQDYIQGKKYKYGYPRWSHTSLTFEPRGKIARDSLSPHFLLSKFLYASVHRDNCYTLKKLFAGAPNQWQITLDTNKMCPFSQSSDTSSKPSLWEYKADEKSVHFAAQIQTTFVPLFFQNEHIVIRRNCLPNLTLLYSVILELE